MSEIIGNIVVACSECHASGVPFVNRYVWWRNAYGARIRIFCHVCGCVTEKTEKKGIVETELKPWKSEIRYPPAGTPELPF
jgi:hypothetical protein